MKLAFAVATESDAESIAELRNIVSGHLAGLYPSGPKASRVTDKGVLYDMRTSRVVIARALVRNKARIVATLRLATKKPWAIDTAYFTKVQKPLYLTTMAVHPEMQRRGVGRKLLKEAKTMAKSWPSDAIRLDAYDFGRGRWGFLCQVRIS